MGDVETLIPMLTQELEQISSIKGGGDQVLPLLLQRLTARASKKIVAVPVTIQQTGERDLVVVPQGLEETLTILEPISQ
jgi:hypothetical protein